MTKKKDDFNEALEAMANQNIYYKLSKVKAEIGVLSKNAKNPFFKSDYLDLNGILSAVEPLLEKYGLLLLQPIEDGKVITKIIDIDGGVIPIQIVSSMELIENNNPQQMGSQISYFRRYTLQSLLGLQAVDDDAQSVSNAPNTKSNILSPKKFNDALEALKTNKIDKEYLVGNFDLTVEQLAQLENYG